VPGRPEVAQLEVDQAVQSADRLGQQGFEPLQLLAHALGGGLLQLDAVLHAVDFVLRIGQRLLQLRTVAEQLDDARVLRRFRMLQFHSRAQQLPEPA
jgi:hypothetical protein